MNEAVLKATGKAAVQPPKNTRRPTVIEEEIDEDNPPRSTVCGWGGGQVGHGE